MEEMDCKYCEEIMLGAPSNKLFCGEAHRYQYNNRQKVLAKMRQFISSENYNDWIDDDTKEESIKNAIGQLVIIQNPDKNKAEIEKTFEILKKEETGEIANNPNNPIDNPNNPVEEEIDIEPDPKDLQVQYDLNKRIEEFVEKKGDDPYTEEDKAFIIKFTGYGGLDKAFPEDEPTGPGILFEYFTPETIVEKMWGLAYLYGYNKGPVLEPSAGTGAFLQYAPKTADITAYELNPVSAKILSVLYPNANVITGKFENAFIENRQSVKGKVTPKYDLVIGNPPYGPFSGLEAAWEKGYTKATNYIDYFITRSLDLLNKDGLLIFIIGGEVRTGAKLFIDRDLTGAKKIIREKSILLDAYRLPNGVFDRTDVLTDIIVLRKK